MVEKNGVGRLAPSPTGELHLGHALSFLAAFWNARSSGATLRLRLDDVDTDRSQQGHIQGVLVDLQWLGLSWDGAPQVESQRSSQVVQEADRLLKSGKAYPCTCTRGTLRTISENSGAPHLGDQEARYPGHCRGKFTDFENAEFQDKRSAGLRLIAADEEVSFVDRVYGSQAFNIQQSVGDFIILRRNKEPAYQLSVVIADHLDDVTEVVRGRDLLESTARQLLVARALGLNSPSYAHLPLVCDFQGQRLAKRSAALSLSQLRNAGVSAETLVGWVAQALHQRDSAEPLPAAAVIETFDVTRIGTQDILLPERPLELFL
jgi:glutamyl-tRNA synthetase